MELVLWVVQPLCLRPFTQKVFHSHITMWGIVCKFASFLGENRLVCHLSKDSAMPVPCRTSRPSD